MISYRKLWLLTKDEFIKNNGKEPAYQEEVIKGLYFSGGSLASLTDSINLEDKGAFDFAVPQEWFDKHYNEWKDDRTMKAVWFYPPDAHIFGRPLRVHEMLKMLKDQILQEAAELWVEKNKEV